jgi:thiamine biosynthesis lipoprotein
MSNSVRRAQPLLGTFVEIAAAGAAPAALEAAIDEAFGAVALVHRLMSFHDAHSDVSRLNRDAAAGAVEVHPWTWQVLDTALALHRRSAGLFDVTVAPLLQSWGLLPSGDGACDAGAEVATAADRIALLDGHRVRFGKADVRIDLGGIAKGFAVDRALDVLRRHGVAHGLVNAGGDLAVFGGRAEAVQIRNPLDARRPLCAVEVCDQALASSGRIVDPLQLSAAGDCAIADPISGRQIRAIAGATVRAPCCMIADALTKIVMIGGEAAADVLRHYAASALFVLESGDVRITSDWQNVVRLAA